MINVKDKLVTVESLSALYEDISVTKFDRPENDIISIENGGTNSSNGAEGLQNLLAVGPMVLSPFQYGDELPEAGVPGRIFFKRIVE